MTPTELEQFKQQIANYGGSDVAYKHSLSRGTYTEGVRFVATELGAYWLLDYIFSVQFTKEVLAQKFQVWKLKRGEGSTATLALEDGNGNQVTTYDIEYTDFPLEEMSFWLINNILLLPSEY